jgi:transcriptional regulator with XRE-family HTH domain
MFKKKKKPTYRYQLRVFAGIVKAQREADGYSIRELAALAGIAPSQVLRVESGRYDVRFSTILALCEVLPLWDVRLMVQKEAKK